MEFTIAPRARDIAGVENAVARFEKSHVSPGGLNGSCCIPAERCSPVFVGRADFGINGVYRDSGDTYEQVVVSGSRVREPGIDERGEAVGRLSGVWVMVTAFM